jgi:Fur family transcriptional regulator, ferric uptake regulator
VDSSVDKETNVLHITAMNLSETLINIKSKGRRVTKVKRSILECFSQNNLPLAAHDISIYLKKHTIPHHRSTVYREIESLSNDGVICPVLFQHGQQYYELKDREHHHHLICNICQNIQDIHQDSCMHKTITEIQLSTGFEITSHSLEFFGICPNCSLAQKN